MQYLCLDSDCITKKNQFFTHRQKQQHSGHASLPIHPFLISSAFADATNVFSNEESQNLKKFLEDAVRQIKNDIKRDYPRVTRIAKQILTKGNQLLDYFRIGNEDSFSACLSKGYEGGILMIALNFFTISLIDKNIKIKNEVQKKLKNQIQQFQQIKIWLNKLQGWRFDETNQINDSQVQKMLEENNQNESQKNYQTGQIKNDTQENISYQSFEKQIDQTQKVIRNKFTKRIKQRFSRKGRIYKPRSVNGSKQKAGLANKTDRRLKVKEQNVESIQKVLKFIYNQQKKILFIYEGKFSRKILDSLLTIFSLTQELHIFNQLYGSKETIEKILTKLKSLTCITLNCENSLSEKVLLKVAASILQKMKKIQYNWDFNLFYQQYEENIYFARRKIAIKSESENFSAQLLAKIPKLTNIWICNEKQIIQIPQRIKIHLQSLTIGYNNDKIIGVEVVNTICGHCYLMSNLKTIVLRNLNLNQETNHHLKVLIKKNKNTIKTLILYRCQNILPFVFEGISELCLQKLMINGSLRSFENNDFKLKLEVKTFLAITSLKYLSLISVQFVQKLQNDNSGEQRGTKDCTLSEKVFEGFKELKRLVHLNLYDTQPIIDLFPNISTQSFQQIDHLNIGFCEMNNHSIQYLKHFKNLKYLNLDCTGLSGQDLIKIIQTGNFNHLKGLSLQSFNGKQIKYIGERIQEKPGPIYYGKLEESQLNIIAQKLPQLQYINLSDCQHLTEYKYKRFKNLKCLRLSQNMMNYKILKYLHRKHIQYIIDSQEGEVEFDLANLLNQPVPMRPREGYLGANFFDETDDIEEKQS